MASGMLLGKFMPPHLGHVYLVEFASHYVDDLSVVVGSLKSEPIPGAIRYRWMRELFPFVNVIHLTDENPQEPQEHPDFWNIWRSSLLRVLPGKPDFVFASEDYGGKLAEILDARFVPVDRARAILPVSGTAVRNDPLGNWDYLPRCVRPYYLRRVCVFGPESTGKTTLARRLAERFGTVAVPEYARTFLEAQGGRLDAEDISFIARGQTASEAALAPNARRVLFCDTDVLSTQIWSEVLFGASSDWLRQEAERRTYDLYLLLDVDVPWVADVVRYLPENRRDFLERCRMELEQRGRPYVRISGNWEQRFSTACEAVERLLAGGEEVTRDE